MTPSFAGTTVQICAFALGLAAIHAVRDHSVIVTRILVGLAITLSALLLLIGSLVLASVDPPSSDDVSVYQHL